ncbi:MAG: glycoside hydrolase family 3 N-terminal domain-containing protein [Candidatus Acidiferrum sp.]
MFVSALRRTIFAAIVVATTLATSASLLAQANAANSPLQNPKLRQRVEELLKKMTLDEKIGQLNEISAAEFAAPPNREEMIKNGEVGSFLWSVDPARLDRYQHIAVEQTRLHIPLLFGYDVIHGFRTVFPSPIAMASSWDPSVEEKAQSFAAREARSFGIHLTWAPMVDIARDARWGRIVEGAGEDPYLGSAMARAQVRGFQGADFSAADKLIACVKHYVAYGAAEGGRDYDSSYVPESSLRNVYLPPFKAAVEAGVGSLMSAYMDLNDVPASGNRFTLHDILRGEWKFQGFVVTDAFAARDLVTHGYARDPKDAAFKALTAGVNMDMGSQTLSKNLKDLVNEKKISLREIDEAVRPILAVKFQMGLFEHPYADATKREQILNDPAARTFSRVAARRSMVLLKNEGHALPLSKAVSSIALIGPLANSPVDLNGGWGIDGQLPAVTLEQGLRKKLPGAKIAYERGGEIRRTIKSFFGDFFPGAVKTPPLTPEENAREVARAVELARNSDISILVLGELSNMSSEAASRSTLELPSMQEQLLEQVVALGKPVVLVIIGGRPLNITWASEHVPAILEAWQPGTESGNAIADILFGDVNPGAKLPISWPRSAGQEPLYYSHNLTHQPEGSREFSSRYWEGPSTPLYPFGYGLSYTTFSISNLRLGKSELRAGESMEVTADVENTGAVAGDEVVQLYIHQQAGSTSRPVRELKGFERVSLKPGEKKTVHFKLGKEELTYWSSATHSWVEETEQFDVWVGNDSKAKEHATFRVIP